MASASTPRFVQGTVDKYAVELWVNAHPDYSNVATPSAGPSAVTTTGGVTLTAAQILGGHIVLTGNAANVTFPTAELLVDGVQNPQVGDYFITTFRMASAANATLTAGANQTLSCNAGTTNVLNSGAIIGCLCVTVLTNVTAANETYTTHVIA